MDDMVCHFFISVQTHSETFIAHRGPLHARLLLVMTAPNTGLHCQIQNSRSCKSLLALPLTKIRLPFVAPGHLGGQAPAPAATAKSLTFSK